MIQLYLSSPEKSSPPDKKLAWIALKANSKSPLHPHWLTRKPLSEDQQNQHKKQGHGIGLRLGRQPDGRFLIALDEDTPQAKAYVICRGIPPGPAIQSARGRKLIYCLPPGLEINYACPCDGLELLGEDHQICLPSLAAPDERYWIVPIEDEIPLAPLWLAEFIEDHQRKRSILPRHPPPSTIPAPKAHAPATQRFLSTVLPHCQRNDSNAAIQLGAGIVAHRADGLKGERLVRAIEQANRRLTVEQQVDQGRLQAIASCIQRKRYGFSPQVFAERTGTPLHIACKAIPWRCAPQERERMRHSELARRVRGAIYAHGKTLGPSIKRWVGTKAQLAQLAKVPYNTFRQRKIPQVQILSFVGRQGYIMALLVWGKTAAKWLMNKESEIRHYALRWGVLGGQVGFVGCAGVCRAGITMVTGLSPPVEQILARASPETGC